MAKSFYLLELWVKPGGYRKAFSYVFNNFLNIRLALEKDLSIPLNGPWLILLYGETIKLSVYRAGKVIWEKDLHPYITFYIPGCPPLQGTVDGKLRGVNLSDEDLEILCDELDEMLSSGDPGDFPAGYRVDINWAALDLPPLDGPLLQPGESVVYPQSYTNTDVTLTYGENWLE